MCCFVNRQQRHIPSAAESIHTHTAEERSDVRETEYIYIRHKKREQNMDHI